MQGMQLPLRASCTAHNAYHPSVAIATTFVSALYGGRLLESSVSRIHRKSAHGTRWRQRHARIWSRAVSTTPISRQQSASAEDDVQAILQQDERKLGLGGTYANYDLLKASLARDRSKKKQNEPPAPNAPRSSSFEVRKMFSISLEQRQAKNRERGGGEGGRTGVSHKSINLREPRPAKVETAKVETADEFNPPRKPYSWQAHMQKIAREAGIFSKEPIRLSETALIEERRKTLDYTGRYIEPMRSSLARELPIPWALRFEELAGKTPDEILEEEIRRFVQYTEPTPAEKAAREAVIADVLAQIARHMGSKNVQSEIYGSETTGLALATSDIDVRVSFINATGDDAIPGKLGPHMKSFFEGWKHNPDYFCVTFRHAHYPIINAQHKATGIDIQIVSAPPTSPQQEVTLRCMNDLPNLRALYILIRAALGIRGLVDVYTGGTGSYGLLIMLVASLQRRRSHETANPTTTLKSQLLHFLHFYTTLDITKYGLTTSKLFKKHDADEVPVKAYIDAAYRRDDPVRAAQWSIGQRRLFQPYLLCLQDPANALNDLGRKSNAVKHLVATLEGMKRLLRKDLKGVVKGVGEKGKGKGDGKGVRRASVLGRFVGPCHEVYYERRRKVEEFGLMVLAGRKRKVEEKRGGGDV